MGRYDWDELLKRWRSEMLTSEQAIGQLLLWCQEADGQLQQMAATLNRMEQHLWLNDARIERLERQPPI